MVIHEKNWRVSFCVQKLQSTKNALNSCSHSGISELARPESAENGCPRSIMVSFFVIGKIWLAWWTGSWLDSRPTTGFSVLSSTLKLDTGTGEVSLSVRSSLSRVSLSLDVAVVGGEDELEQDVEQYLSYLEGVIDVEWELDEELADTTGTKFTVSHCIRIPSLMRCDFWPLIHSSEYPFSSQSFPSDNTAGVFSRTFIVNNISNSLTSTVASWCVCTSPLPVMTIVELHDFVKVSISAFKSCLLIICIDALESKTNSRSSSSRVDASKHLFSEGEKNAALFFSFHCRTHLASFHAASRAPCSCHSVSSRDRSSKFGALGLRWWGSPGRSIRAKDCGLEFWCDVQQLSWISHVGLVSACLSSSVR